MLWMGERCSTLPGCDSTDRLEMVEPPSTSVLALDSSPELEMGPGSIMSPEITGRESGKYHV